MKPRINPRYWAARSLQKLAGTWWDDSAAPAGSVLSFSEHGEDLVARELMWRTGHQVEVGFYVDVGAYHPWRASNTATFYRSGWRGIAVDPNPYMAELFRRERPRDTFVGAAVSDRDGSATLFKFGDLASSNTIDSAWADSVVRTQHVPIEEQITVPVLTLAAVLDRYLPRETNIDLLSVDVEGSDMAVLVSNDWTRYRPNLIAVEEYEMDLSQPLNSDIYRLLRSFGYRLASRTVLTNFYVLAHGPTGPTST